jgi:hypothetical protein
MDNPILHQRKHDLVEAQSLIRQDNGSDQPLPKKKRTFSLKRPSSSSHAPATTVTASSSTKPTELTTATITTSEKSNPGTTAQFFSVGPISQQDNPTAWNRTHTEGESVLPIQDSHSQKGCALQKIRPTTTTVITASTASTEPTTAAATTAESTVQCLTTEEKEDLDDFKTPVLPAVAPTKAFRTIKTPPTTNELSVQGPRGSSAIVNENEKDGGESIIDATNLLDDPMHDLDCEEAPIINNDFELDEIQDWDDFEDNPGPIDPVPENACPVCGVNLLSLDTMVGPL